jgi:cytochrome c
VNKRAGRIALFLMLGGAAVGYVFGLRHRGVRGPETPPGRAPRVSERVPEPRNTTGKQEDPPKPAKAAGTGFVTLLMWTGVGLLLFVLADLAFRGFKREATPPVWEEGTRDTDAGRQAILRHGCGGCHVIPGIRHATGRVGPRLNDFRNQMYIAGVLANVPENLASWIANPQKYSPGTAMPNLQVTEEEARAIATYLYANP